MDNGPDREDEDDLTRTDTPAVPQEPAGPSTERVRIVGAETAAEITSELPLVPPAHIDPGGGGSATVRILEEGSVPADADAAADAAAPAVREPDGGPESGSAGSPTELPHWTEPPTGQVPAVLARDTEDTSAGILPPTWREEDADWTAQEEGYNPAIFSEEGTSLGALDEAPDAAASAELRPWEFDLGSVTPGQPGPRAAGPTGEGHDEPPPAAPPEPADAAFPAAPPAAGYGAAPVPGSGEPDGLDQPVRHRPTGEPRVGRARRSGLRPGRVRAKRPDEGEGVTEAPLAAEPPGASVTEVPGAGRRRGGVAGLAAADRSVGRVAEPGPEDLPDGDEPFDHPEPARRRSRHRAPALQDRPRSSSDRGPEATGGGPPEPTRRSRAGRPGPEVAGGTGLRVGTGVAVAVVALVAFKLGTVTSLVLALVVVTFAAGEAFAVLRKAGYRPATLLGLVGTLSLMIGAYDKGVAALPLVFVLIVAFTLLWYLFGVERGSPVAGTAATLLVVGWVSLLGAYAGLLLSPSTFPDRHGVAFLLGAIIATVANDVGALVTGRWVGSRALAPNVSPNKTWEGLVGGALGSIVVSTVAVGAIHPWSPSSGALLGVVVAVVAPLGDLCESLLKRDLRLKDMGTMLPGHGGVLDRVDALLFVLPATYYLVRALNIG